MAMEMVILVEGVSKAREGVSILREVSFQVGAGESVALVGPSGSGKTTLLRLIAGLDLPSSGRIVLNGRAASSNGVACPPHQRGVGMVFQRPSLWPHMTVAQNVAFGLGGLPRAEAAYRLAEALRRTSLLGLERRYPHQLSGGEAQRVALARALAPRPPLLLLDEPLSGLDRQLHTGMLELFRRVRGETGSAFLYVTHDHREAEAVTDRVLVLRGGCLEFQGEWGEARSLGQVW